MTNEEAKANLEKLLLLYDDGMIDFSVIRESVKIAIEALRQMPETSDTISRQMAVDAICKEWCCCSHDDCKNKNMMENGFDPCDGCSDVDAIMDLPPAQPNLQPTCNQLATDCISRQAAIDALEHLENAFTCEGCRYYDMEDNPCYDCMREAQDFYEPENSPTQMPGTSDLIGRQAVIDLWERYKPYIAVKACEYDSELRKLTSAQPETHDKSTETHACDLISRQAAIDVLRTCYDTEAITMCERKLKNDK